MNQTVIAIPDPALGQAVSGLLPKRQTKQLAVNAEELENLLHEPEISAKVDLLLLDISFARQAKAEDKKLAGLFLNRLWQFLPQAEIIVLGPSDSIRELVDMVKAGAANYLTYPLNPTELAYVLHGLAEEQVQQSELDYLRDYMVRDDLEQSAGVRSRAMVEVMNQISRVAATDTTLLLTGETGTGKSFLAKKIHHLSKRSDQAFISIHCGAIPDNLVESELFGHEKGAFTGSVGRKLGRFEIARGGTLFLDEVGTLSPAAQVKLLQVLQERTFQRVGGLETLETDVRIIAAANQNLKELADLNLFRTDLYYRLNVFPIRIPALAERKEDIPLLVQSFLSRLNLVHHKQINRVDGETYRALAAYSWPGNIRELENLIERAYILETGHSLSLASFPAEFSVLEAASQPGGDETRPTLAEVRGRGIEIIEIRYLEDLLRTNKGRIDRTARAAGISTRQLHKLMTKYGLRKENFFD